MLLAAAQQSSEGQGPGRDNAVRSLFTDTAERRRQQQEKAAAVKEAEELAAGESCSCWCWWSIGGFVRKCTRFVA